MQWIVRVETVSDYEAIDEVQRLAFGQANEARLVRALRGSRHFMSELSLVAEAERLIVGHILFTPICIRGSARTIPALSLAPMGVLPAWQRRGVGSSLVQEGIERCRQLGHERIIVVGHSEYYPRFDFVLASQFGIRAPFLVPEEAFMALALQPGALADCAGTVEYPPAFADLS